MYAEGAGIGVTWNAVEGVSEYSVEYRTAAVAAVTAGCSVSTHGNEADCTNAGATWTAAVAAVAAGEWSDDLWSADDGESVEIDGLTAGTTYDVRVAAVSALGVSPFAQGQATPSDAPRPPGAPENVVLLPTPGGLMLSWDPPRDRGNPGGDTVQYAVLVKPVDGWDCATKPTGDPNVFTVWTVDDADDPDSGFPLWVAVYCVTDAGGNYVAPDALEDETGWAKVIVNITGPDQPVVYGLYSFDLTHLPEDLTYEVQMQSVGVRVQATDDEGQPIEGETTVLASDWTATDPTTASPAARPPDAPTNLALTPGAGEITVAWDDPLDAGDPPLEGWIVQWRKVTDPESDWNSKVVNEDSNPGGSHVLTGLDNDTEYQVRVAAFHDTVVTDPGEHTVSYELGDPGAGTPCPAMPTGNCYVLVTAAMIGPYTDPPVAATPGAEELPGIPRNLQLSPGDQRIAALWDAPRDLGNPALDGYAVSTALPAFCSDSYDHGGRCTGAERPGPPPDSGRATSRCWTPKKTRRPTTTRSTSSPTAPSTTCGWRPSTRPSSATPQCGWRTSWTLRTCPASAPTRHTPRRTNAWGRAGHGLSCNPARPTPSPQPTATW